MISAFHDPVARVRHNIWWFGVTLCLWQGGLLCGLGGEAGVRGEFAPFQIIVERNIFAPHSLQPPVQPEPPAKPVVLESLVLVGTLSYEKGDFAFFEGNKPELSKVLTVGENLGDCTVTEIAFQQVNLKSGSVEFALPVGERLIREDAGPWRLGGKADNLAPIAQSAAENIPSPESNPSRQAVKEWKTSEPDFEKNSRRTEKKLGKYAASNARELKKAEQWNDLADGFSEGTPKKPKKRYKNQKK